MYKKKESQQDLKQESMLIQVENGLKVNTYKHPNHDYLIPTKDVAFGYGVSTGTLRTTMSRYPNDFKEGTHYVRGVSVATPLKNVQPHAVLWTKKGVIQLGFHIQGRKALVFRQWAESVILEKMNNNPSIKIPIINEKQKRNHNRLTTSRLVEILADVALIENKELRISLLNKLMPEQEEKATQLQIGFGKGGNA